MARWLGHNLLLAVAYLIAGRLGQYLAAPPIYATAVWPASGVALAGLLLMGYRTWPGLFLGAVVVNSWSVLLGPGDPEIGPQLIKAARIGYGATMQAVVGAWLIRRYVGFPNNLTRERDIFVFLTLGGPLACLIGASAGVLSLVAAGNIQETQILGNWWTWWVGDVIGVIIFAPLVLIFFAQPRQAWRSRRMTVAVPLFITLIAVAITFTFTHIAAREQIRLKFERHVSFVFDSLKQDIDRSLDVVHSLEAFYTGSVEVNRAEFEVFSQHLLNRHKGIQALGWNPHVRRNEREQYEQSAREAGFSQFDITERAPDRSLIVATERDDYYPVYFVVPHEGNEPAFGFDVGSNDARLKALIECRDSGQQVATEPIRLVQQSEEGAGILVFMPIYKNGASKATTTDRRNHLLGFVSGVFRVPDIIHATLPGIDQASYDLTIFDTDKSAADPTVYQTRLGGAPSKAIEAIAPLARTIRWTQTLPLAGRQWQFDFVPNNRFLADEADDGTWLVLAGGLLFTSLLGLFLLIMSGRASRVEELVVDRTRELTSANLELEREITARKKFEDALERAHEHLERRVEDRTADLKASEARYQDLYHHAPDMFVSVNVATQRLIECNKTFLSVTGFDKDEIIGRPLSEIYHTDSHEIARKSFEDFLKTGRVKDVELKLLRKDASPLDVSLNVSAVRDERGQLMYSRAVLRDISEKKLAEAKIKQHEADMAHVARLSTMGEMAAGLAHEINQPLAAIAAYADGVAIRLRNEAIDSDQLIGVVGHIADDAHRAGEVIRRLRQFVRNREPDRMPIDINPLVLDVAQFVAADAAERQIRFEFKLADDLPLALSDTIEFQQVLLNLVRNGFDAMNDTPAEQRVVRICTRAEKGTVEVSVEDQGHGLPGDSSEQVFEAFFTSKDEGLGMGLAISRSIVESHGGRIWASATATGAVFHFTLPVATEEDMQSNPE